MKKTEDHKKNRRYSVILMLPVILIAVFVFLGYEVWIQYRNTLMDNQTDQLLMVSEMLKNNIEISIMEYEDDLNFLCLIEQEEEVTKEFYRYYLDAKDSFICNIVWEDAGHNVEKAVFDIDIKEAVLITRMNETNSIYQYTDADQQNYLAFRKVMPSGRALNLLLDEEDYYTELISDIRIGTNGYIVVKSSSGQIIMHPDSDQWGIDVIEGRKEMYPGLDFSSLERMIEKQKSGETGISEYYSYWWMDDDVPRVKKLAAYVPAAVGEDFWIISGVTDYDDFYIPIQEGFVRIILVFVGIMAILLILSIYVAKLSLDREKSESEIIYLKELNALLEEVHRNEEVLAHQERLQIMGTVTSGIAHEFNNFLTPILGYAELLMMELPERSEEYEGAREIYEAAEKATDVVRQISTLSRKNVETVYKSIAAEPTLNRALKLVESVCPMPIRLEGDIQFGDTKILGNATQINQVVLNICVNAIHAIGKNEGRIFVRGRNVTRGQVEERVGVKLPEVWANYIQIDIEDNGKGMEPDTMRQIFDPFFTTKTGGEGTGLGLALVEQIIHSHKGYICVDSEPGEGSRFHIFFPVLETERIELGRKKNLQLVIVDDNAKVLQLLEKNFARLKSPILTCRTKEELQRCLDEHPVDVLVIEQILEGVSSIDFAMAVKEKYPGMVYIITVDAVTREIVEAKQRKIIDSYIEKPVSVTMILETIRTCMEDY